MGVALYDHQLDALERIHNGSVLKGGVGSGKSITALAYFYTAVCGGVLANLDGPADPSVPRPKDIIVITTAKKRDKLEWQHEALSFRITVDRDTSINQIQLTVDSWNNIPNYTDVKDAFFIFDEQRLVGSGIWVKSFLKIAKNNEWILLSATPGDAWLDYAPVFIANGFYRNITEFKQEHCVYSKFSRYPKIDRYIGTGRLSANRRRILVSMDDERHTRPHDIRIDCSYGEAVFDLALTDRWHVFENRPIRDFAELIGVLRKIVNSEPSRINKILEIAKDHPKLIIFYNFNYELEILRKLEYFLEIPLAEWNGQKHEEIPNTDRWIYLVQYTAGAEGWNCIDTDCVLFYSLNYSYRITQQAKGRIDRINTPFTDLYYYYLQSTSVIDKMILKALSNKKNFNEKEFEREVNNFVSYAESSTDHD